MARTLLGAMLWLCACELLGGCAQTTATMPAETSGGTAVSEALSTALPAGAGGMRQDLDAGEHVTPYADLVTYPDNWPEIARRRGGNSH